MTDMNERMNERTNDASEGGTKAAKVTGHEPA
jgi:hypothetical protein